MVVQFFTFYTDFFKTHFEWQYLIRGRLLKVKFSRSTIMMPVDWCSQTQTTQFASGKFQIQLFELDSKHPEINRDVFERGGDLSPLWGGRDHTNYSDSSDGADTNRLQTQGLQLFVFILEINFLSQDWRSDCYRI